MIEYIILATIIIYITLASIEDIKKREVYDYLNFSLAFFILSAAIFHSFIIESIAPIKYAGFGMLVGFSIGALLFYLGIWGGGDAKFILGFGASSFYLMDFTLGNNTDVGLVYQYGMVLLSDFFSVLLNFFLKYLIILDFIFIVLIILQFFMSKRKDEKKDLIFLLGMLFILLIGLYFEYDQWVLVGLGFLAFILIFIAREGIFSSVYFKYKKALKHLNKGDKIDSEISIDNKTIVAYEHARIGLSKEEIHLIKEKLNSHNENNDVLVRKSLPYGMLIALNFLMYMFKIIIIDDVNLTILSFMFKFMFFSFIAGGIIAIGVVFYYYIKNHNEVKVKLSREEVGIIVILTLLIIVSYILFSHKIAIIIFSLIPIYLFIKIAKAIETVAFIKKKKLSEIVLGDWIIQDIKIGHKVIYHKEDFKIGVDEEQLAKLKKLDKTHHNLDNILVKDGIAFLPALYIGFILMFII